MASAHSPAGVERQYLAQSRVSSSEIAPAVFRPCVAVAGAAETAQHCVTHSSCNSVRSRRAAAAMTASETDATGACLPGGVGRTRPPSTDAADSGQVSSGRLGCPPPGQGGGTHHARSDAHWQAAIGRRRFQVTARSDGRACQFMCPAQPSPVGLLGSRTTACPCTSLSGYRQPG